MFNIVWLQGVAQVLEIPGSGFTALGSAAVTLLGAALHLIRRFHKAEIAQIEREGVREKEVIENIEGLRGDFKELGVVVRTHMEHAPDLTFCAKQASAIRNTIFSETRRVRDDMTELTVDRGVEVRKMDDELQELKQWAARHNGFVEGSQQKENMEG